MKKLKAIWFFIIFLVFLFLLQIYAFINNPAAGDAEYLKQFLESKAFWVALLNSYVKPLVISFVGIVLFNVLRYLSKSKKLNRPAVYNTINVCLGGFVGFIVVFLETYFIYRKYNPIVEVGAVFEIVLETINLTHIIIALQSGVVAALVFWFIELICCAIRQKALNRKEGVQNNEN